MIRTPQGILIARDRPRKMHEHTCDINLNCMRAAVIDPDSGKIEQEFKAESYVENYLKIMRADMRATSTSIDRIDGSSVDTNALNYISITGVIGLARRGILLGGSDAATNIEHIDLQGRFDADVTYSQTGLLNYVNNETDRYYDIVRTVTSQTDNLEIKEMGMAGHPQTNHIPALYARDVLPSTVTLMNDEGRVFRYRCHFDQSLSSAFLGTVTNAAHSGATGVPDIGGSNRNPSSVRCDAGIDELTKGIRISHSDTPVLWNDYTIADMYDDTDFYHMVMSFSNLTVSHPVAYFEFYRDMVNKSGAAQVVRKFGFLFYTGGYVHLGHADLLPVPITVGPDEGIRITYRFGIEN